MVEQPEEDELIGFGSNGEEVLIITLESFYPTTTPGVSGVIVSPSPLGPPIRWWAPLGVPGLFSMGYGLHPKPLRRPCQPRVCRLALAPSNVSRNMRIRGGKSL